MKSNMSNEILISFKNGLNSRGSPSLSWIIVGNIADKWIKGSQLQKDLAAKVYTLI